MQHAEKWDMPPLMPLLILGELPLVTAAMFLARSKSREGVLRGAGLAFGAALAYLILAPLLYLRVGASIWDTGEAYRYLVALRGFIPISFLGGLWLLASASRQRGEDRVAFNVSVGVTIGYAVLALLLMGGLSVAGSGVVKEKKNFEAPVTVLPVPQVRALTACLIRRQFAHPEDGFPSSLKAIGSDWNCDMEVADPGIFPKFWIFYSPVKDPTTHRITDFRIQAVPADPVNKGMFATAPVVSDGRGAILSFPPRQTIDAGDSPSLSVYVVRDRILEIMRTDRSGRAPLSLQEFQNGKQGTRFTCDDLQAVNGRRITIGQRFCYSIAYFPPPEIPDSFAISAQCRTYGDGCLRSYFLDYDGIFHATSEPRPATAQDPALLSCEAAMVCHDPIWTDSEQPSDWMFFKAKIRYLIYSTNWW